MVRDFSCSKLDLADFSFAREVSGDYWFRVSGQSQKILTDRYMEQSMVEINEVVYGSSDGAVGVERLFPWNFDVVVVEDEELKGILEGLVKKELMTRG